MPSRKNARKPARRKVISKKSRSKRRVAVHDAVVDRPHYCCGKGCAEEE